MRFFLYLKLKCNSASAACSLLVQVHYDKRKHCFLLSAAPEFQALTSLSFVSQTKHLYHIIQQSLYGNICINREI